MVISIIYNINIIYNFISSFADKKKSIARTIKRKTHRLTYVLLKIRTKYNGKVRVTAGWL